MGSIPALKPAEWCLGEGPLCCSEPLCLSLKRERFRIDPSGLISGLRNSEFKSLQAHFSKLVVIDACSVSSGSGF